MYVTARDEDSQGIARDYLNSAYIGTNMALYGLSTWPGDITPGYMYKSNIMFSAVLSKHRDDVTTSVYFWDEMEYYTSVIDVIYTWYMKELRHMEYGDHDQLWKYLMSYSYLLGSINYVGGDQALCSVFQSVVCFSYMETFYYVNFSMGGESVFRLYRHSSPLEHESSWKFQEHSYFFPDLVGCRKEIMADMNYNGVSIDPSACDYAWKNESRFQSVDILTIEENSKLISAIKSNLAASIKDTQLQFIKASAILGSAAVYFLLVHISRCSILRYLYRQRNKKWKEKYSIDMDNEQEKFDHSSLDQHHYVTKQLNPTVIGFEDYSDCNCTTNYIKVATV